jgi:hypothetical protein
MMFTRVVRDRVQWAPKEISRRPGVQDNAEDRPREWKGTERSGRGWLDFVFLCFLLGLKASVEGYRGQHATLFVESEEQKEIFIHLAT